VERRKTEAKIKPGAAKLLQKKWRKISYRVDAFRKHGAGCVYFERQICKVKIKQCIVLFFIISIVTDILKGIQSFY
jgi:hypothetical protein